MTCTQGFNVIACKDDIKYISITIRHVLCMNWNTSNAHFTPVPFALDIKLKAIIYNAWKVTSLLAKEHSTDVLKLVLK